TSQADRYITVDETDLSGGTDSGSRSFTIDFGADGYGATAFTGLMHLDIGSGVEGNIDFDLSLGDFRSTEFTSDGRAITFTRVDDNTIRGYVADADNGGNGDETIIELT